MDCCGNNTAIFDPCALLEALPKSSAWLFQQLYLPSGDVPLDPLVWTVEDPGSGWS